MCIVDTLVIVQCFGRTSGMDALLLSKRMHTNLKFSNAYTLSTTCNKTKSLQWCSRPARRVLAHLTTIVYKKPPWQRMHCSALFNSLAMKHMILNVSNRVYSRYISRFVSSSTVFRWRTGAEGGGGVNALLLSMKKLMHINLKDTKHAYIINNMRFVVNNSVYAQPGGHSQLMSVGHSDFQNFQPLSQRKCPQKMSTPQLMSTN